MDWDVLNLVPDGQKVKSQSLDETTHTLYTMLEQRWQTGTWQSEAVRGKELVILIENQPAMKNPIMKSIQMLVYGFFAYKQVVTGVPSGIPSVCHVQAQAGRTCLECNTSPSPRTFRTRRRRRIHGPLLETGVQESGRVGGVSHGSQEDGRVADCSSRPVLLSVAEAGACM